ncbi:C1 family peptidase [Butyrivibrio sp. XBB1001]|uniref:C1 family peptidase n=1 Tax=Butyrivibrio sp. XBB1001 TaxID=1280682 RepID=UPI00040FD349|nr:C1 family peptidase [Butyrivibrio sp. XBB1001]
MKKKVLISASILVAIAVVIFLVISQMSYVKENPSRRDGQVVEGADATDLDGVNGELDENYQAASSNSKNTEAASERQEADSALMASLESMGGAEPVSKDVESVEVVLLPEAVTIEEGDLGLFYGNDDFSDIIPVDIHSFSSEEIPEKYDSRDVDGKNYVTPVEDQGYTYLCWTYASLGAIESDILKHYPEFSRNELDLSEKHLAYYNMHKAEGSVNGYIDGDYREFVNADNEEGAWIFDYDTNYVATGGVADFVISLLTAWKGPVYEQGNDSFNSIYGEKYLFKDNASLPSPAYTSSFHVQNVLQICSNIDNNKMIKQMIMEHGAVTCGVCADSKFFSGHNLNLYSDFGGAKIPTADHEVMIVGWDDSYSRFNFRMTPPSDGAWICRNSWGNNSGENGFFYLSYYDQTTGTNNVAAYDIALEGDSDFYDHNYQAAGFITYMISTLEDSDNYVTSYSASTNPYGMLYTAAGDEKLKAIGLMGLDTYQQYKFDIYVNPRVKDNAIQFSDLKEPAASFKGSAISGGFHTFELEKEIDLAAGDEFFILVSPYTPGRVVFESAVDAISKPNYDEWDNLTGNVHNCYNASGCSFYIVGDGTGLERQEDKDFFVKAYTTDK